MSAAEASVLVTPRSYRDAGEDARRRLEGAVAEVRYNDRGRALSSAELAGELTDVDGVIAGLDHFDAVAIAAAPRLQVIARYGTGVERVDLEAAAEAGVVVTNTPDANANAVAELALALILALLRRIPMLDRSVRAGAWDPQRGVELSGKVVGILGLGRIGAELAWRARALGASVIAHDPYLDEALAAERDVELVGVDELFARAEIVSLHAPVSAETTGIVDAARLASMPEGAVVVNTARGELIDEEALVAALDSGHIAGSALDSLSAEPPSASDPLVGREDVIVTPHVGAQTDGARRAMAEAATADLIAVLDGAAPRHPVTPGGGQ